MTEVEMFAFRTALVGSLIAAFTTAQDAKVEALLRVEFEAKSNNAVLDGHGKHIAWTSHAFNWTMFQDEAVRSKRLTVADVQTEKTTRFDAGTELGILIDNPGGPEIVDLHPLRDPALGTPWLLRFWTLRPPKTADEKARLELSRQVRLNAFHLTKYDTLPRLTNDQRFLTYRNEVFDLARSNTKTSYGEFGSEARLVDQNRFVLTRTPSGTVQDIAHCRVTLFDRECNEQQKRRYDAQALSFALSPNGQQVAVAPWSLWGEKLRIEILDIHTLEPVNEPAWTGWCDILWLDDNHVLGVHQHSERLELGDLRTGRVVGNIAHRSLPLLGCYRAAANRALVCTGDSTQVVRINLPK